MLFSKACREVLEGILLLVYQQFQQNSALSAQPSNQPRVSLNICAEESSEPVSWSVRVDASDLGIYYLDEKVFVTKLYTSCGALRSELDALQEGGERRELCVLSRRIGEYSTVQKHSVAFSAVNSNTSSDPLSIEESALPRPSDFPPYGLRVCFQLGRCTVEDMKREARSVQSHVQLLHLTNSHVKMELVVKAGSEVIITRQFSREQGCQLLPSSHFKLALSMEHFTSSVTRQTKLRLTRGASYTLAEVPLRNGSQLPLRLYCSAAVAPRLSLPRGRKIPANKVCHHLRVYVFGPGGLPLSAAGSLGQLSLSSLADWDTFGLSLSTPPHHSPEGLEGVVSCGGCCLSNSQGSLYHPPIGRSSGGVSRNYTLLLFLFLEATTTSTPVTPEEGGSTTTHWSHMMEGVCELKEMMERLLYSQQKKFRQATHSVLNKLLCNYGSHSKTASTARTALPQLADAVASIIRQSTNPHFQEKCHDILQTDNYQKSESEVIADRLWEIAGKKLHVSKTHTKPPQEPPSPELEQALVEDKVSVSASTTNTSNDLIATASDESLTTAAAASNTRTPRRVCSETSLEPGTQPSSTRNSAPDGQREAGESSRTTSCSGPRKFSLFASTITSKRTKRDDAPPQPISLPTAKLSSETAKPSSETTEVAENWGSLELNCFEALASLEVSPEQTVPLPDEDLPHSNSKPTPVPSVSSTGREGEGEEDLFFEQLATAEDEEYNFAAETPNSDGKMTTESTVLEDEGVSSTELMDWGEESEDEFLEDMENEFSNFPSSSESCGEDLAKEEKTSFTEVPLIGRLVEMNTTPSRKLVSVLTATPSDSDWEMLGEMADNADETSPSQWLIAPAVKPGLEQEAPVFSANSTHSQTVASVPDISLADCSFTAGIDEDDFHWD